MWSFLKAFCCVTASVALLPEQDLQVRMLAVEADCITGRCRKNIARLVENKLQEVKNRYVWTCWFILFAT